MARKSSLFQNSERFLALEEVLRWLEKVLKWLEEVLNLPPFLSVPLSSRVSQAVVRKNRRFT